MKPKLGDIVECEFLDHVEDGDEPIRFMIYGKLRKSSPKSIAIAVWAYPDNENHDGDSNEKVFSIVRRAIINLRKLN